MKKRNCTGTKGYNCGQSCISVKYACIKDGLSGQSINIANRLTKTINDASTKLLKKAEDGYVITSEIGGNKTEIAFAELGKDKYGVYFFVNGEANANDVGEIKETDKRKIAKTILSQMRQGFKEMPEGSKFTAEAYFGDGKGKKRQRLYQKFGFSEPDSGGEMYAIKEGGVIKPSNEESFEYSETDDLEMEQLVYDILFN